MDVKNRILDNIKISADLSEALNIIAEKLGVDYKEIIPEYAKTIRAEGIALFVVGIIGEIISFILIFDPTGWVQNTAYFVFIGVGLIFIYSSISMIFAPTGLAIEKLLGLINKD